MKKAKYIFAPLLFVFVMLWWILGFVGTMSYHEQYQMFLLTSDYLMKHLSTPGGFAEYIGEFLTQFYIFPSIGGAIIAAVLTCIVILAYRLLRGAQGEILAVIQGLLVGVAVFLTIGNPDVLLAFPVAVAMAFLFNNIFDGFDRWRWALVVLGLPLFYWLFGTMTYFVTLYVVVSALRSRRWLMAGVALVLTAVSVAWSGYFVIVPFERILSGLGYCRYPVGMPKEVLLTILLCTTATCAYPLLANRQRLAQGVSVGCSVLVLVFFNYYYISAYHEPLQYDYLVRTTQWQKIVEKAEKKSPNSPMTAVCLNLALQQTGQLTTRQFDFYQNGVEGLLMPMNRDMLTPLPTAEAFLRLGMVDAAQWYFFEAQEAIPNYGKSARITKRLVETNIINGEYAVARKYLHLLQQTMFYRHWADEALASLVNEEKIEKHPMWGDLRKKLYTEDFLFSPRETDKMLGRLLDADPTNRMAYEYLMSYIILSRDLTHFYDYFQLGKDINGDAIPAIYQQVHALIEANQKNDPRIAQQYGNTSVWRYLLRK